MEATRSLLLRHVLASRSLLLALLSCSTIFVVTAPAPALADVPGRVGRIAFMQGDVQAYSEADPEWKVAYLNQPITSRNSLFVGDAGRAEISVGSTTLAMDAGSQVDIQQLDDNTFDANVVRGRVSMRIRRLDPSDEYNVAVPGASFALLRPGRYRIDSLESTSGVTVFEGQASVESDRAPVLVQAGNAMRVAVDPRDSNAAPQLLSAAPTTVALDDWVVARENRFQDSQAQRYVSPNMTGYEDLDANGRWASEQDVGPIWYPTTYVQADWAPYRYGRWAYVAPWGYTWIDDAPWGFAPFHYGRWIQVGGRWGWTPGAYVQRPAYAPALVGFYGGSGFSASFAVGAGPAVGWYPLAPWERYSPHYTRNSGYVNQVNNIVIVNPPRRFVDGGGREWNRERGGTVAPRDAFASQRSISRVAMAAPRNLVERAPGLGAVDLPRPAGIPGAVRRGPDGNGGVERRPDFRSPREFASRPFDGAARALQPDLRPGASPNEGRRANFGDRPGVPSTDRRIDERRPEASVERALQTPGVPSPQVTQTQPRGPDGFDRGGRSVQQPSQPGAPIVPVPSRVDPRFSSDGERFTPRNAPLPQADGEGVRSFQQRERAFERPNREMRNVQPMPQGQPQVVQPQQQPVERAQRFERPQVVQPQVVQPQVVQPQAQPAVERSQRFERPPQPVQQPQAPAIDRPQRIERAAPIAPVAPVAPAAPTPRAPQPRSEPSAPRGDGPGAGGMRER